eukprot:41549-Prymnesium_polylepis.1
MSANSRGQPPGLPAPVDVTVPCRAVPCREQACPTSADGNLVRARRRALGPAVCSTHGALSVPSDLPPPHYPVGVGTCLFTTPTSW